MKKLLLLSTIFMLFAEIAQASDYRYIKPVECLVYNEISDEWYNQTWYLYKNNENELAISSDKQGLDYFYAYKNTYDTFEGKNVKKYKYYSIGGYWVQHLKIFYNY